MFGFVQFGPFDYFGRLSSAVAEAFEDAGVQATTFAVSVPPTASIRRRAAALAAFVAETAGDDGPIHLVGHSTGGLDARIVASPTADMGVPAQLLGWLPRLRSVTTMATPHFGTPLASFFARRGGERAMHAVSAAVHAVLVSRAVSSANQARLRELLEFVESVRKDEGVLLQLTPEAMDLFRAGVEDRPGVCYQCVVAMAPKRPVLGLLDTMAHPSRAAARAVFSVLHSITSQVDPAYPCGVTEASKRHLRELVRAFGTRPLLSANDGVVPVYSQLWGRLAWAGYGDHLDVLGHFRSPTSRGEFGETRFDAMVESMVFAMVRQLS
jgi:triacylglycerol esterase/lipase EstA (alpha/beta hydrolase family)